MSLEQEVAVSARFFIFLPSVPIEPLLTPTHPPTELLLRLLLTLQVEMSLFEGLDEGYSADKGLGRRRRRAYGNSNP